MIYHFLPIVFVACLAMPTKDFRPAITPNVSLSSSVSGDLLFDAKAVSIYENLNVSTSSKPSQHVFSKALVGFFKLRERGAVAKDILTVVDFGLSSTQKRLWVIDIARKKVLFNTYVAHGRHTGEEFAEHFSNTPESKQSSLGFYTTGEVYEGKHGMSLKLDGLEKGKNDKARSRAVVVHGAAYVSESFIKQHNRLGRSLGCPAVPVELSKDIINTIKEKSCLYIFHPTDDALVSEL